MAKCTDCGFYRNKKLDVPREGKTHVPWCINPTKNQIIGRGLMNTTCKLYKEKLITIVCCLGNKQLFDIRLGKSLLKYHPYQYNLITLPTKEPLADTYNSINCATIETKYIMFAHEDILFMNKNWLKRAKKLCESVNNLGIAGVAGVSKRSHCVGNILHWGSRGLIRRRGFGEPHFDGKIIPVQTLDAQCIIVPTNVFKTVRFDPEFPFHMMVEDYCLAMKHKHNKKVVVIPLQVWHNEGGLGRTKIHGDLAKWHVKLWRKWHAFNLDLRKFGIHATSKAFGIKGNEINLPKGLIYCPKCGADADTLTTHVKNPEFKFECRLCYHRWGRLRPKPKPKVKKK